MDKKLGVYLAVFFGLILLLGLVSAQNEFLEGFKTFWNGLLEVINVIAQPLLGTSSDLIAQQQGDDVLFMKVLLFLIILAVMWSVLQFIPLLEDQTWVIALVSIAASILSTRFLATPGWIQTIMLPYSVLGVAITSMLPVIFYFYFVEKTMAEHPTLRKTAWILAAVIFVGLFISRASEFAGAETTKNLFNPAWIYVITAGLCLIFFLADKTIRRAFINSEMHAMGLTKKDELISEIRRKITQANDDLSKSIITVKEHDRMIKDFKKRLIAIESY